MRADYGGAGALPGRQVDGEQGGVVLAGDEREPRRWVEGEAVAAAAAGRRETAGDVQGVGVDGGEIALPLHGDQHLVGDWVVGDVADGAAEIGGAAYLGGGGVDDRFGAAGFLVVHTARRVGS